MNLLYGWVMLIVFLIALIIGIWQAYDSYYMFEHTLDASILRYKPDPANAGVDADSPITDEMVGWITIDDTSVSLEPSTKAQTKLKRELYTDVIVTKSGQVLRGLDDETNA